MNFKYTCLFILIGACISGAHYAHASVVFSEIMYDLSGTDTDHEWVELYNNGSTTENLTGWKFNDGANHVLNDPPTNGGLGSLEISAGGYVVVAGDATMFLADHPGYNGTLIDSVMSLNNTGDTLSFYSDIGSLIQSLTYSSDEGAAGDGNSLQLFDGAFQPGAPTPGAENNVSGTIDDGATASTFDSSQAASVSNFVEPLYQVQIISKIIVPAGVPASLAPLILDQTLQPVKAGLFNWNFGDGLALATISADPFFHTYKKPGDYVVMLEYRHSLNETDPDASDKLVIKVVDPSIAITGFESDGTIKVSNTSPYDADISGWSLTLSGYTFRFPANTVLLAGKTIALPSENSGLPSSLPGSDPLTLHFPDGRAAGSYSSPTLALIPPKTLAIVTPQKANTIEEAPLAKVIDQNTALAANVGNADLPLGEKEGSHTTLYILFLIVLIGLAGGSALYIRRMPHREHQGVEDEAAGYTIREG